VRDRKIVQIDPSISQEQRNDPRFEQLHKQADEFFNNPRNEPYRLLLGLHEGAHAFYARQAGRTNIRFRGPTMVWDYRYDCPAISKGATSWTDSANSSVMQNIKASIAGFIVRRELTPSNPNDEIAIELDIESARRWFDQQIGGTDEEFETAMEQAERGIIQDLKSRRVVDAIRAEARRFVREVFPTESTLKTFEVGRNETCPCGSGKKFKRCHLGGSARQESASL